VITKPTVLVLGAGASHPYGLPLGSDLVKNILLDLPSKPDRLPPPGRPERRKQIYDFLLRIHEKEDIFAFRRSLHLSGKTSIDAFLESNSSTIRQVGKSVIAAEILSAESTHALSARGNGDWYRYFYSQILSCGLKDVPANKLTVITFNYDRSFEYFLQRSFAHDCGATQKVAAETLKNSISVLHLHGSLGPLPGFEDGMEEAMHFSVDMSGAAVVNAARNRIRIISDPDVDQDPIFERAHNALRHAENVYFLGFGWAVENLRRLIPSDLKSSNKHVAGSSLGMGNAEMQRLLSPLMAQAFKIAAYPVDCLGMLKEHCFPS
jgi:hypothetical protein